MATFTISRPGTATFTFESPVTDADAIAILRTMTRNDFAQSLVQQWDLRKSLSPRQWPWAHKLAIEERERQRQAEADERLAANSVEAIVQDESQMEGIFRLFSSAAKHLQRPKVRLVTPEGKHYRIQPCRPGSRYEGSLDVQYGEWPASYFVGSITSDGLFIPRGRIDMSQHEGLIALLIRLAQDPETVAREYGKLMGVCCFCSLPLTDERSTTAGYGPRCGANFGLEWGKKK